jgi:RecJ-like exonuclease
MTSCIICGTSVDGRVCELHEEDVVFEFRGTEPEQLTAGRYYRGTVDGFADFGIFVDIGEEVTGLLHRSELDSRLESIDLDPGETVYVQVQNVRSNGNVDLGWSIRQDRTRFRGALVDDPDADKPRRLEADDTSSESVVKTSVADSPGSDTETPSSTPPSGDSDEPTAGSNSEESASETGDSGGDGQTDEPTPAKAADLDSLVGQRVQLTGEIAGVRQTSGPTVFTLRDETDAVECAAFEEAGVRAYPAVEEGDIVRLEGELERRRGELQVETETLAVLEDDEREVVTERMQEALDEQARPDSVETLAADPVVEAVSDGVLEVATAIRRAVIEGRPVVVRHAGTVDGYVAGAAIERATLPLVRDQHGSGDAEYHQFERRPLEGSVYDMDDATRDVTMMLSAEQRHDEPVPLFVFVGAGSPESVDAFDLLGVYGARRVVIDDRPVESAVTDAVDVALTPGESTTATTLAGAVGATVNPDVRADLDHLPAVSAWSETPEAYADLASSAGYDPDDSRVLREALALVAHYQAYEDKRELVADLLFADDADVGLAEHISEQYRTRMETAIDTAQANLERHSLNGRTVILLDTDAYTHRYEFPPRALLLDELARREDAAALVGLDSDECLLRSEADIDIDEIVDIAGEHAPEAALDARGARDGRVEFLAGERDGARKALLDALATELPTATA